MEMHNDELKELFSEALHNLQKDPPVQVWEGVRYGLRFRKRKKMIVYAASIAAILLVSLIPLWRFVSEPYTLPQPFGQPSVVQSEKYSQPGAHAYTENTAPGLSNNHNASQLAQSLSLRQTKDDASSSHINNLHEQPLSPKDAEQDPKQFESEAQLLANHEVEETAGPSGATDVEEKRAKSILAAKMLQRLMDEELELKKIKDSRSTNRLNLAFAHGSVPGGSVSANELLYENSNVRYRNDAFQSEMAYETSFYEEIERTDVQPPLTLGAKVSYQVGKRFFLETGISYTSLSVVSKTVSVDNNYNKYFRTLYYLGIPLGVRWDVLQNKILKSYLSQSVVLEKGIRAINKSNYYENNRLSQSDHYGMPIPGFQFSTLTTLGADLTLYGNFSVYGEAGMQIFYLNSTQPFNMRSAKMTWPVFQTGVRVNF